MKKVLITGAAGFIGFHLAAKLRALGWDVTGIDNLNPYYDLELKYARLRQLGIDASALQKDTASHADGFSFYYADINHRELLESLFAEKKFDLVFHLAAQAGVRHSLKHPEDYITANVSGFLQVLECCRKYAPERLFAASTSSVYGLNPQVPSREDYSTDQPANFYAATKKANETMAFSYSHLYGLNISMLRFFTVYGPYGRPDMALYIFSEKIRAGESVPLFNGGNMQRDFTYIDDITESIRRLSTADSGKLAAYDVFNIGNGQPVALLDFVKYISEALGLPYTPEYLPMQPGDLVMNYADCSRLQAVTGFKPGTPVREGVKKFIDWLRIYKP